MKVGKLSSAPWEDRFDYQKTILFGDVDLKSTGSKFQVIKLSPGRVIKPHFHNVRTEVFYVLRGVGEIFLSGKTFSCVPHDFFLCEVGEVHAFSNPSSEDFVIGVFRTNDPGDSDMIWVDASDTIVI